MEKTVVSEVEKVLLENAKQHSIKKLWDNYTVVAEVLKNERLKFVIAACTRDGFRCINIREFYYVKRDDVWKPGRDGIVIPMMAPFRTSKKLDPANPPKILHPLDDFMQAMQEAISVATDMPLEDVDNAMWLAKKKED